MNTSEPGEAGRFYERVWPHADAVLRVARILAGNDADADDLAQETLMKAFRSLHTLRDGAGAKAWLMTILRHNHIDHLRSTPPPALSLDAAAFQPCPAPAGRAGSAPAAPDPEDLLESFSDSDVIGALRALPKDIRWTLLLADVEQLDHHDVAAVLGVPVGTVKSRVHRARSMVKDALLAGAARTAITAEPSRGGGSYEPPLSCWRAAKQFAGSVVARLAV
jgi:RNA polymerase sigma-70 factor (ECF subfamily)